MVYSGRDFMQYTEPHSIAFRETAQLGFINVCDKSRIRVIFLTTGDRNRHTLTFIYTIWCYLESNINIRGTLLNSDAVNYRFSNRS